MRRATSACSPVLEPSKRRRSREPFDLHAQEKRALERVRNHKIPVILRARERGDFVAVSRGTCPSDPSLERVEVHFDGISTELFIDAKTGRLACLEFTGRGLAAAIGRVALSFTSFELVGGVRIPSGWTATFDGKPAESMGKHALKVSAAGTEGAFRKPGT